MAIGGDNPWERPIDRIAESLTGPVLRSVTLIAIVVSGMMLAIGESSGFFRKGIQVVFGLSIAIGSASLASNFFS